MTDPLLRTAADGSLYGIAGERCFRVVPPIKDAASGEAALRGGAQPREAFAKDAVLHLDLDRVQRIVLDRTGGVALNGVQYADALAIAIGDVAQATAFIADVERAAGRSFTRTTARAGWFAACGRSLIVAVAVPLITWVVLREAAKPPGTHNERTRGAGYVAIARSLGPTGTIALGGALTLIAGAIAFARYRTRPTLIVFTRA